MLKDLIGLTEWACASLLVIFALGWIDFGQGPQYTWWSLMQYIGSNV